MNGSASGGSSDKFCSSAGVKFLRVDLGQSRDIRSVVVRHAGSGGEFPGWNTRDYDIQVSDDGTTWSTAASIRGNTADVGTHSLTASGRYVKLDVLTAEQTGNATARIYEFEVYG